MSRQLIGDAVLFVGMFIGIASIALLNIKCEKIIASKIDEVYLQLSQHDTDIHHIHCANEKINEQLAKINKKLHETTSRHVFRTNDISLASDAYKLKLLTDKCDKMAEDLYILTSKFEMFITKMPTTTPPPTPNLIQLSNSSDSVSEIRTSDEYCMSGCASKISTPPPSTDNAAESAHISWCLRDRIDSSQF